MKSSARSKSAPPRTYQKGLWAEAVAVWFLRVKGYRILAQRYKTPMGEADIIAKKRNTLVCVEVKFRAAQDQALEAVNPTAQKRITAAADIYRSHAPRKLQALPMRFDILTLTPPGLGNLFFIRHHIHAWYGEE